MASHVVVYVTFHWEVCRRFPILDLCRDSCVMIGLYSTLSGQGSKERGARNWG